jgi:hypothetical protein
VSAPRRAGKPVTIRAANVGGVIGEVAIDLLPGVNELTGGNGSNKTSLQAATVGVLGGDPAATLGMDLERHDGAPVGTVEGAGVTLRVEKVTKATGRATVSLADTGALGTLIEPGGATFETRNQRRIKALVDLVKPAVTDDRVEALAGGDPAVLERSVARIRAAGVKDLLAAAEVVRLEAHKLKREHQTAADEQRGEASALARQGTAALEKTGLGVDELPELDPARAEQEEKDADREVSEARLLHQQRQELERQQEEVRTSLGSRPDPASLDARIAEARKGSEEAYALVTAAEQEVEEWRQTLERVQRDLAAARQRLAEVKSKHREAGEAEARLQDARAEIAKAAEAWGKRKAVLERPLSGPHAGRVEELEAVAARCSERAKLARLAAEVRLCQDGAARAAQEAEAQEERAKALDAIATTVGDRLATLLGGTAAAGLTVVEGRLAVVTGEGTFDFETRRSPGQRNDVVLEVAREVFGPSAVVPLTWQAWASLDDENKRRLAEGAAALGQYWITERATSGALGLRHLPEEEAL